MGTKTWRYTMGQKDARIGKKYPMLEDDDEYMNGWEEEMARQSGDMDPATPAEQAELDRMGSSNT